MADPVKETKKRLILAEEELNRYRDFSLGAILAGSVAYAPNLHVTKESDVDLVVVVEDIKETLDNIVDDDTEKEALQNRFFEGYCIKRVSDGVPISIHVITGDAFDIISKCFVADMRVYRKTPKDAIYKLKGFEGNTYDYRIKNIQLNELSGVRTIVPISFINNDRYFIGIHRDKLLCKPHILHERNGYIAGKIDKLWYTVIRNLCDESMRLYGTLDLNRMNILNTIAKKDKLSPDAKKEIEDKTDFYISKVK
ncbi:hypothetical protein KY333_00190 [Candidatus Woesearchaeota archaeon]|nr:hypothetical protein [Candidatus Woesearchaeota archaeon]